MPHHMANEGAPEETPARILPEAHRVDTADGARLAVFVYDGREPGGETEAATPLLCLHGNGGSHAGFERMAQAFCRERAVIVPDMRDQGISTRGRAGELTYELLAEDAVRVLDALGVGRACVLGSSDGGIEALLIARDHPERTAGIVTMGANLVPEGVEGNDEMADDERLYRGLAGDFPAATRQADLLRLMLDHPHIDAASLATISCPATIMAGEFDVILPEETERIAAAVPGARKVIVPAAGHGLMRDDFDTVEAQVRDLLERIERE
jgi:pimeloyl-ACP methyl ester carboxylesterase